MRWSDIQTNPSRNTLRQFAGLCLVFFTGLALWQALARGRIGLGLVFAALALSIGPLGLIRPEWVRPVYVGWMRVTFPIGWLISQFVLAVIFFGLLAPVGVVFRLAGRDPLNRTRRPGQDTYWAPKPSPVDLHRYFKQF
jgi:hypothetical protein